ncbi:MAG: hypothetical protein Kow0090_17290 [Myxococcota bacterium]
MESKFAVGIIGVVGVFALGAFFGIYACGGEESPGGLLDDGKRDAGEEGEGEGGSCAKPCRSDLDCPFGEKCECPPEAPNCRVSEMCCSGGGGDEGELESCISSFDCDPGYECQEVSGMTGTYCVPPFSAGDDDDDNSDAYCGPGLIPMVSTTPKELRFVNAAIGLPETLNLVVANEGTCDLKVTSVEFENATASEFSCDRCSPNKDIYPAMIPPGGSFNVSVTFTPKTNEVKSGAVLIISNDPDYPLLRVPLASEFKGKAILKVTPDKLAFGHVNKGDKKTQYLTISNAGIGNAALNVMSVYTERSVSQFSVSSPDPFPVALAPGDDLVVDVVFAPTENDTMAENLIVEVDAADNPEGELEKKGDRLVKVVPLSGASVTEPRINIKPTFIDFGEIPADQQLTEFLEICNDGGTNLEVGISWDPLSDPYFQNLNPTKVGTIPEQACFLLAVTYKPELNEGSHKAILRFTSNDSATPEVPVEMIATATNPKYSEALKLEMTYDNNASGWATGDLRRVSLLYMSDKYGICDEVDPKPDWLEEGRPRWSKVGNNSNPQYVFHAAGIDDENINVGLFSALVSYDEDCASIPIDLVAQILNIGPDLLLWYLSSGAIPPGMIDIDLGNMCLSRKGSNVNVTAYINGQVAAAKGTRLGKKGNVETVFLFQRKDGKFIIM